MYLLRSNKSSDSKDSDGCEISLTDLLNNEIIKSVFSDIINTAIKELYNKVTTLEEEVVLLRESNIELIHLLTNSETINKQNLEGKPTTKESTTPTSWPTGNSNIVSTKNLATKSDQTDKVYFNQQNSNNKNTARRPQKPQQADLKINGTTNKQTNYEGTSKTVSKYESQRKNSTRIYGTGKQSKSNLTAVDRKGWIYIGRVTPGTGIQGMREHIDVMFPKQEFIIEKLPKWKNGNTEAFKIGFSHDLLDEVYNSDNWPKGSLIKKYTFFRDTP